VWLRWQGSLWASAAFDRAAITISTAIAVKIASRSGSHHHRQHLTAPPPLCPSGSWAGNGAGGRIFTCADGSGTITANFVGDLEYVQGATGPWTITGGTGTYTALRGKGTGTIDSSTGDNPPVSFSETWTGTVDFDATAPTGSITSVKITRPSSSHGHWKVKVVFSARDNVASNPVSFTATATAGAYSTTRSGTISSATSPSTLTFTFHPARQTRLLHLQILLSDPWSNQRTIKKTVRLR
jgi:hypothetical protein